MRQSAFPRASCLRATFLRTPPLRTTALILLLVALAAAQDRPTFRVKVDMVVLSFTITDSKGHYINGLKPKDFRILEDGIPQRLATLNESNKPPMDVAADGSMRP